MIGTTVFAYHEGARVLDFERHTWSRNSVDGHLNSLACDSQNNYCALKIKTVGGIQTHSQSVINGEVDDVEAHFDSLGKKMSIDRVTSAKSIIKQHNLDPWIIGFTDYKLHCDNYIWFWCVSNDPHFISVKVLINNDSNEFDFQLEEDQSNNEHDIRKTLGHELFHAMGIDHKSHKTSIVFNQYVFGANNGYTATTKDRNALGSAYP